MSGDQLQLARPHFLFNSTGQLARVKQWVPEIIKSPAILLNSDKINDKSKEQGRTNLTLEQCKVSSSKGRRRSTTSSQGSRTCPRPSSSSSESDNTNMKKGNIRRFSKHLNFRVSFFAFILRAFLNYFMGGVGLVVVLE